MLANLHTHTNYTDGADSVEAMADAAYAAGFAVFGFSEHSYTPMIDGFPGLTPDLYPSYREDVLRAKDKYAGRMEVFLGLEQDILTGAAPDGLDYAIGSVHSFETTGGIFVVDDSRERLIHGVQSYFGGDIYKCIHAYYEAESRVIAVTGADIVGHFDLVMKYNEGGAIFDEGDPRYLDAAFTALDELLKTDAIFEINTGAMSRGYRTFPYPSPAIMRRIRERGGRITLSSDCHSTDTVAFWLEDAAKYAAGFGFDCWWTFGAGGLTAVRL